MQWSILQIAFFVALLVGALILVFFVFEPYLSALFLAVVLSIVFGPLYRAILRVFPGRETASAIIAVFLICILLFVPLVLFSVLMFQEAHALYANITSRETLLGFLSAQLNALERGLESLAPSLAINADLESYAKEALGTLSRNLSALFSGFITILLNLFIVVAALFFLLRDGKRFKETLVSLSPLADSYDEGILKKIHMAVNSVVKGSLVIAVIQGVLAGIGFAMFGIPNPVLWGGVATIAALIPSVGTAVVVVPAVIYLFVQGSVMGAVGLGAWGILIVGLIDNMLRPKLIGRGIHIHPLLILLSVLGGIGVFGPIGFLAGPIILSLLFALLEIYSSIVRGRAGKGNVP